MDVFCHLPGHTQTQGFAKLQLYLCLQKAVEQGKWRPASPAFQILPSTCKLDIKQNGERRKKRGDMAYFSSIAVDLESPG